MKKNILLIISSCLASFCFFLILFLSGCYNLNYVNVNKHNSLPPIIDNLYKPPGIVGVDKNENNQLILQMEISSDIKFSSGIAYVIIDDTTYSNIIFQEKENSEVLNYLINDFIFTINKTYNISKIAFKQVDTDNVLASDFNFDFKFTNQISHVMVTMKPFIVNFTQRPGGMAYLFEKSYVKYCYFNMINSEDNSLIENAYRVQAKYTKDYKEKPIEITTIKDVENKTEGSNDLINAFNSFSNKNTTDYEGALYDVSNNEDLKKRGLNEFNIDFNYCWFFNTKKPISDFRLLYCWYETSNGIVQGSAYENGMYSAVDENGNEIVYNGDGTLNENYIAENGVIKDAETGLDIELPIDSLPLDNDENPYPDNNWWDNLINGFKNGTATIIKILKIVGIVSAVIAVLTFSDKILRACGLNNGLLYYLCLPIIYLFKGIKKLFTLIKNKE